MNTSQRRVLARRLLDVLAERPGRFVEGRGLVGEVRRAGRTDGLPDFFDGNALVALRWLEDDGYIERRPWHRPVCWRATAKGLLWAEAGIAFDVEPEPAA